MQSSEPQWKCIANSYSDFLKPFTNARSRSNSNLERYPFALRCRYPFAIKASCLRAAIELILSATKIFFVETKAINELTRADDAQLINELKATGLQRGLLLNFGAPSLQFKRLVRTASENLCKSAKSADNLEEIVL